MLHIITIKSYRLILLGLTFIVSLNSFSESGLFYPRSKKPTLIAPIRKLYSHKKHAIPFSNLKISCLDCHRFAVKSLKKGPLAAPIKKHFLKPDKKICHQCHLGRVTTVRRHQCALCHTSLEEVKPKDHFIDWKFRHGVVSQLDRDSCTKCHKRNECSKCHQKQDRLNPQVHRGNYRLTHSISARANPAKCITCHKTVSYCRDCHMGKRR